MNAASRVTNWFASCVGIQWQRDEWHTERRVARVRVGLAIGIVGWLMFGEVREQTREAQAAQAEQRVRRVEARRKLRVETREQQCGPLGLCAGALRVLRLCEHEARECAANAQRVRVREQLAERRGGQLRALLERLD